MPPHAGGLMDHLKLQSIGSQEVNRVPSFGVVGELARAVKDLRAELLHQLTCLVNLLASIRVERNVMKPHFVNLERMRGKLALGLPDVEHGSIAGINVNPKRLPVRVLNGVKDVVAEKLEKGFEEPHRQRQVADRDRHMIH